MTVYNKLVRDKIPEIIKNDGRVAHLEVVPEEEMIGLLMAKLAEESRELEEAIDTGRQHLIIEECADVLEVLMAVRDRLKLKDSQIEKARLKKLGTNGGFEKGIRLLSIDDEVK